MFSDKQRALLIELPHSSAVLLARKLFDTINARCQSIHRSNCLASRQPQSNTILTQDTLHRMKYKARRWVCISSSQEICKRANCLVVCERANCLVVCERANCLVVGNKHTTWLYDLQLGFKKAGRGESRVESV